MFTGIVEELGVVAAVEPLTEAARLTIECRTVMDDVSHGASISVNGVCLTVASFSRGTLISPDAVSRDASSSRGTSSQGTTQGVTYSPTTPYLDAAPESAALEPGAFTVDVMQETLDRSGLGALAVGDRVNLERSVRLADRLGGHLVQGHIDGVGTVVSRTPSEHWDVVRIAVTGGLDGYLVEKGSITVDGVSLTVVDVLAANGDEPASFTVSLIPTTLKLTTLGLRGVGETVNIEVDVVAKYVAKYVQKLYAGTRDLNGTYR
jgi:riboflavin synthase